MAKSGAIAERYAKALFQLADSKGLLDAVAADLRTFSAYVTESADLAHLLTSPLYSHQAKAKALDALVRRAGLTDLTRRFLGQLAENGRLDHYTDISVAYADRLALARGEHTALVTSAAALKPAQVETLKAKLTQHLGGSIRLETKVDPELLGGLVVKIGSRMIDHSLRGKLDRIGFMMKGTV